MSQPNFAAAAALGVVAAALGVVAAIACVSSAAALPLVAPGDAMGAPQFIRVLEPVRRRVIVRHAVTHPPNVVERSNEIYRPWVKRPYYGVMLGGAALGAIIVAETAHVAPLPPALNMCWSWSDAVEQHGYWDYCVAP
jgi:hypothetical protein